MSMKLGPRLKIALAIVGVLALVAAWQGFRFWWYHGYSTGERTGVLRKLFSDSKLPRRVRIGLANQRIVMRTIDLPPLKDEKELASARQRHKLGLFAVEGEDLVDAGLAAGLEPVELLVAGENVSAEVLASVSGLPAGVGPRAEWSGPQDRPLLSSPHRRSARPFSLSGSCRGRS